MSTNAFQKQLEYNSSEGGIGILVEEVIKLGDVKTTGGLTLTASTGPTIAATETNGIAIVAAASTTACGTIMWTVPNDYDQTLDELKIRILAEMSGATDATNTLDATLYRKRAGTAISADLAPVASAVIPASASPTDDAAWLEISCSGLGFRPGDCLTINLFTAAHTTNAVNIWGIKMEYRSMIVANNISDRV